jgi:hypothetical protein
MKAIAAAVMFALGVLSANSADAQYPVYQSSPVVVYSAPVYSSYYAPARTYSAPVYQAYSAPTFVQPTFVQPTYVQPTYVAPAYVPAEQNFFERLVELERRKNAWLRQTFLGIP